MLIIQILLLGQLSFGQDTTLVDNKAPEGSKAEEGWTPTLKVSFSFSQQSSDSVIGQQSGDTIALGTVIDGGLIYKKGRNELRENLKAAAATSKSPNIPRYTKSADELSYKLLYLRSLENYPNWGPYFKLEAKTTMFKGEDFQSGQVVKLTDAFKPLTTKESVGAFGKLINTKHRKLEVRLGVGALQVAANDQLKVDSYDPDVDTVPNTSELESYSQAGVELGADYEQKLDEKSTLKLVAELFQPIDPDLKETDDRSGVELLDSLVTLSVTTKAYEWLAFSLESKYQRQPQLQDKEQKQISLLANISFSFFEKPAK